MAPATQEVVVLGANFAGLGLTHILERRIFPVLKRLDSAVTFHVTVVTPNSHFFFKVAAPRAISKSGAIADDSLFRPISEGLKQYGDSVSLIQGKAVKLTPETRKVTVETNIGERQDVAYDYLFISTGTTSASPLWTLHDNHEKTVKAIHEINDILPKIKSVLIAGAGPVGVETAGEIAHNYPEVKITIVSAGEVLNGLKPGTSTKAKQFLKGAKAEVLINKRVKDHSTTNGSTKVELDDGSSRTVDLFIDSRGASKINNDFLPGSWLDATGRVTTRDAYFRVKGDGQADVSGVYVVGDIVSGSTNTAIELDAQVLCATSSFSVDVARKLGHDTSKSPGLLSYIPLIGSWFKSNVPRQAEFKPMKDTILVPFGPTGGVGQIFGWGAPSFMVKKAKAEKFLIELVEPAITGNKYAKIT
ncbi:hypothetical protein K491DRAFT_698293 [Lophiostoma macrostomum CBS 122681]|uniref:FAD/NAD(P)-binding domain-containing protein n=1 Tax=Lophiostoma macrostomum CBS 122681 TaxID=1314788 RepID=A0A6A6SNC1_9PLEO|nr:hypothetical protein K491DRAFT_698293 [Lophiostoma macrostomum CBS 122681]